MKKKDNILAGDRIDLIKKLAEQYQYECEKVHSGRYTENIEMVLKKFIAWIEG